VQAELSAETFADLGYKTMIQTPVNKDFNLDLLVFRKVLAQENRPSEEWER
jgi:hypothetical protein